MKRRRLILWSVVIAGVCLTLLAFCDIIVTYNVSDRTYNDVDSFPQRKVGLNQEEIIETYGNSVKGHAEKDTIVGNFSGNSIDTLYVSIKIDMNAEREDRVKYFTESNNPALPTIELYGCLEIQPKLVYEGDVDGDGKDEWGYLHTWENSQWRYYRIYNYDNSRKEWRFLYYDAGCEGLSLLDTPEYVRSSGVDIVEKGPAPGLIKINYGIGNAQCELRDTIVRPTYTKISKEAW